MSGTPDDPRPGDKVLPSRRVNLITLVLAALLGAILAIPANALWDSITDRGPEIEGESTEVGESEASLLDAIHAAAEEAVEVDDGKYKGKSLKVVSIELTADNPHITAYRVILKPTD